MGKEKVFLKAIKTIKSSRQATVYCDRIDCFAAKESKKWTGKYFCECLADNDFGGKPCPFYKTKEQQAESLKTAEERRIALAKEKARKGNIRTISGVIFTKKED